jgi:hypothetical protein
VRLPYFIKKFVLEHVTTKEVTEILPGLKLVPNWDNHVAPVAQPEVIAKVWQISLYFRDGTRSDFIKVIDADRWSFRLVYEQFFRWYFRRPSSPRYQFVHAYGSLSFLRSDLLRVSFTKIDRPAL